MLLLHLSQKKEKSRDLIGQSQDYQHKQNRHIEISENFDLSLSNAQAFKTLNLTPNSNTIEAVKHRKGKVNPAHIVDLVINLVNTQLKGQSVKFVKNWSLCQTLWK